jgi:hypothetical protein
MKYLKILGLAAAAAVVCMALFGSSSASATVLCSVTQTTCSTANHIDHLSLSIVKGTSMLTTSTGGASESTCTGMEMTVAKKATGSASTTPVGSVATTDLKWTVCAQTAHTLGGGELEFHHIAGTDNGTVKGRGFRITTITPVGSCIYGFGTGITLGTLTGGHNATLDINAVVERQSGSAFFCPADSIWVGQWQITNHTNVYVVAS